MNLCTNAYHAMQTAGRGVLTVGLRTKVLSDEDTVNKHSVIAGEYVFLEVRDTGVGMNGAVLEKIFDPYFTTKEKGKGTGLGLSVVHGIVSSHKGYISVSSKVNIGTVFSVYFPLLKRPEQLISRPKEYDITGGKERLLIVDDELGNVSMLKIMLRRLGYTVTSASSGIEAWELFKDSPKNFDCVITDMTMPKMTGAELSKNILTLNPGFPIILMTGFSETMDRERANSLGIKAFILKPILKADLAKILRDVLQP